MKSLILGGVAAALCATAGAFAQAPTPAPQVQTYSRHMPMRVQSRNEVAAHARDLFARLDTNRDGFVTSDEAEAAHRKMGGDMRQKFAKRLAERGTPMAGAGGPSFDRFDLNKDGVITRDEFAQARTNVSERRVIVMRDGDHGMNAVRGKGMHRLGMGKRMFEMADANRDGRVSLQEMTDGALRHFDSADANHDGQLSPDERTQGRKMRVQRQPAR